MDTPQYKHDSCDGCKFLGKYTDDGVSYDLYYCSQHGHPTVIARWSDEPSEYMSGMPSLLPPLMEAKQRAKEQKLITE